MSNVASQLLHLYQGLIGGVVFGLILSRILPPRVPGYLGQFLFWIGAPIAIVGFLRQADLSGAIWLAPVIAWISIFLGMVLAWLWIRIRRRSPTLKPWSQATRGSFILSSILGNTGYLGLPIVLSLVGPKYFGWAVFYDGLGSAIGTYGLGVLLAARFGLGAQNPVQLIAVMFRNPALWSLGFGLLFRQIPLPPVAEQGLRMGAWSVVGLSLVLMGMRLSQLSSWRCVQQASVSLAIKMLIVPLIMGTVLAMLGFRGVPLLVIVLQMATPPAFAVIVFAEAFNLDRQLSVTAVAMGLATLLFTLPFWLFVFGRFIL